MEIGIDDQEIFDRTEEKKAELLQMTEEERIEQLASVISYLEYLDEVMADWEEKMFGENVRRYNESIN